MDFSKEYLTKAAHFVPCSSDLSINNKSELIINALYLIDKKSNISIIKEVLADQFGCDIHRNEIEETINILIEDDTVLKIKENYVLSPDAVKGIKDSKNAEKELTEKVLNEWIEKDILPNYPKLNLSQIEMLKNDVMIFLKNLFLRHGIESLNLINKDIVTPSDDWDMYSIISNLNTNDEEVQEIEFVEFPRIFSYENDNRKIFLLNLLDKAFRYLTLVCSPDVFEGFKEQLKNKAIYLDSNVVYRLVNLQGIQRCESIKEVIKICKEYNIQLKVSYKTLEELHRRLKFDSSVLKKYPVPKNLLSVGIKYLTEENYVSTYWYEAAENGVSLDDFIDHYKHIDLLLEDEGIIVEKNEPDFEEELKEDKKHIMSSMHLEQDPLDDEYKKSINAIEHDSYHLALVRYLRGPVVYNFLDGNAWFMTTDQSIIKLQKDDYYLNDEVPVAILPSQLIQILRIIIPSNKRFDEAFIDLFSRSLSPTESILNNKSIQEIIYRIGKYSDSPRLANRILMDKLFKKRFISCESEGEKEELIHNTIKSKIDEIEEENKVIQEKMKKEKNLNKEIIKEQEKIREEILAQHKQTAVVLNNNNKLETDLTEEKQKNINLLNLFISTILFLIILLGQLLYLSSTQWQFANFSLFKKSIFIGWIPLYWSLVVLYIYGNKIYITISSVILFIINLLNGLINIFSKINK